MEKIVHFYSLVYTAPNGLVTLSELESLPLCCHPPFSGKRSKTPAWDFSVLSDYYGNCLLSACCALRTILGV